MIIDTYVADEGDSFIKSLESVCSSDTFGNKVADFYYGTHRESEALGTTNQVSLNIIVGFFKRTIFTPCALPMRMALKMAQLRRRIHRSFSVSSAL